MRDYLHSFLTEFNFNEDERVMLMMAFERVAMNNEATAIYSALIAAYNADTLGVTVDSTKDITRMAEAAAIHPYTAILLVVVSLTRKLRERLVAIGLSKKSVTATLTDIKYKVSECKTLHGVVGTEHWSWYVRFFELRLFTFGRLQFQLTEFAGGTFRKGERVLKRGDHAIAVHIPRTETPLREAACLSAYAEAKAFFTKLLGVEDIAFTCSSWLLYPKNRDFLPEKSNIVKFMNQYNIVSSTDIDYANNTLIPFLFQKPVGTPVDELPEDTTLRAAYKAHLKDGGAAGVGLGIFFLES